MRENGGDDGVSIGASRHRDAHYRGAFISSAWRACVVGGDGKPMRRKRQAGTLLMAWWALISPKHISATVVY